MDKAILGHEQQTTNNKIIFTVRSFSISHRGPNPVSYPESLEFSLSCSVPSWFSSDSYRAEA